MNKWIKATSGVLYNLDHIVKIEWKNNLSATTSYKFEMYITIANTTGPILIGSCTTELEKSEVEKQLYDFISPLEGPNVVYTGVRGGIFTFPKY